MSHFKSKEEFKSRSGFLLAAMGSAIGLGNIWRYPVTAYENGGGSFLIPYLVALFTAGIPLLILEFNLGHRFRGSAPEVFKKLHPKLQFVGWWQTFTCFIIPIFYSAVIAWLLFYTYKSFSLGWGNNPEYYFKQFLQQSPIPQKTFDFGGINLFIVLLISIVWTITTLILIRGVQKGIERMNKIMIPALIIMFLVVVIYSITLNGAIDGLEQFFMPQWNKLGDPKIWLAAYGQVFFSTSVAAGMMITYASYTPQKSDLNSNAIITGLGNSSIELAAGFGVFAALGFLASQEGTLVNNVVAGGPGLIFTVYPSIINQIPSPFNHIIGPTFYLSLVFAGFSSLISLVEVVVSSIRSKFNLTRHKAVIFVCIPLFISSLLIGTGSGMYLLDVIDHFTNTIVWVNGGLLEIIGVIITLYLGKRINEVIGHGNQYTQLKVPVKLELGLLSSTGIFLIYILSKGIITELEVPYGNYSSVFLKFWGWGTVVFVIVGTLVFTFSKKNKTHKK